MPGGLPSVSVLREAVRAAVAASSLRAVARQVGRTPRAISMFMEGAEPIPSTRNLLLAWYVRHGRDPDLMNASTAAAAIHLLLSGVEDSGRRVRAQSAILRAVAAAFKGGGGEQDLPQWVKEARALVGG